MKGKERFRQEKKKLYENMKIKKKNARGRAGIKIAEEKIRRNKRKRKRK